MYLTLIKARRLLARWPKEAWRFFWAPVAETGQLIGLAVSVLITILYLLQSPLSGWWDIMSEWSIPIQATAIVLFVWGLISAALAPFRIVARDRKSGKWQGHHYIYGEPRIVFSGRFEHRDGATQAVSMDFSDAEPSSCVFCEVVASPNVAGRILTYMNGGKPSPLITITPPQPGQVTLYTAPGAHIGFRLPKSKDATLYVRLEPMTTPVTLRVYCQSFFVGHSETDIGPSPWRKAMTSLQKARQSGQVEQFIAEHESDPHGDADKLNALIKRPVQGSGSAVPPASSQDASDD